MVAIAISFPKDPHARYSQGQAMLSAQGASRSRRYGLRELFGLTLFVAIYGAAVNWSMQVSMLGTIGVAFVSAAFGTLLSRRWLESTNVYANGLLGGTIGGALGTCVDCVIAISQQRATIPNQGNLHAEIGGILSVGLLGGILGALFGVLTAIVGEEMVRIKKRFARRQRSQRP